MEINSGDTAWVLVSSALVLLMTPGLAFFYGGLTRAKSTINMMMMSLVSLGIVSVLWVTFGYSLAFGDSGSSWIGSIEVGALEHNLTATMANGSAYPIPSLAFVAFQLMFAIITPALISGAIADRARFVTWSVFIAVWVTIVYFPVAHWVFDFGGVDSTGAGWLAARGVLDFAGGTAVHVNAGAAGLALAMVLGRRIEWTRTHPRAHNIPFVILGAGLVWFGWFGFNAGSALGANAVAGLALLNTQVAAGAGLLGWLAVDLRRSGRSTSIGAISGAIAGLVAITPACAFVSPMSAVFIGLLAGAACAYAVELKFLLKIDDSLDVVGVHLVAGAIGCLTIGFFASKSVNNAGANGLLHGGGFALLEKQALGVISVGLYSFGVTYIIGKFLDRTMGFRITRDEELVGIDVSEHSESAYEFEGQSISSAELVDAAVETQGELAEELATLAKESSEQNSQQ